MSIATSAEPPPIGPADNGKLMTAEEFDAVTDYDGNYVYELIQGVLVVSPVSEPALRDSNEELGCLLRRHFERNPETLHKTIYGEYIRTADSRRRAGRVIWAGLGRVPSPKSDIPTIVVEFVSKIRRDRQRDYVFKGDEYCGLGVSEYWIIDRFQRCLTVFRKTEKSTYEEITISENESYQTVLLPGFELPLAQILSGRRLGRRRLMTRRVCETHPSTRETVCFTHPTT